MIPFLNRTADIILSENVEACDINVREVIEEFQGQCDNFRATFEAFVYMAPGCFRITCRGARKLETAENFGYTIRGWPVVFKPISSFKWVNVTKLSYGVPDEAISAALGPFGPIKLIKSEQYLHVYTGVRNVLMEVARDIPVRFRIAGHWCSIYYKGQKRPCFTCGQEGHISSKCPSKLQDEQHVVNELVQQVVQDLGPGGVVDLPADEVVIPVDPSTTIVGHTLTIPPVDNDVNVGVSVSDKHPTSDVSIPVSAVVNDKGSLGPQKVGEVDKAASGTSLWRSILSQRRQEFPNLYMLTSLIMSISVRSNVRSVS